MRWCQLDANTGQSLKMMMETMLMWMLGGTEENILLNAIKNMCHEIEISASHIFDIVDAPEDEMVPA